MQPTIKNHRTRKGLTQTEVANKANITVVSYQRIEYGTQRPSLETALRIAKTLGTTVDDLWSYIVAEKKE